MTKTVNTTGNLRCALFTLSNKLANKTNYTSRAISQHLSSRPALDKKIRYTCTMGKEDYLKHFNSQPEGTVELINMDGTIAASGTGVFNPQSTELYATFDPDNNPRTIQRYYVLFTPRDVSESILLAGVYSNFIINFHQESAHYGAEMLLAANSRDEIISFIRNGVRKARLSIEISNQPSSILRKPSNTATLCEKKRYRDNTAIRISLYTKNCSPASIHGVIEVTKHNSFHTIDEMHGLLGSVRLYWILYRFNTSALRVTRFSFINDSGEELNLLCYKEYTVLPIRHVHLCSSHTQHFSIKNLHSIMSLLVFHSSAGNSGLHHGVNKFLRLTENPDQRYSLDDFVALPIIALDTITTNIDVLAKKKPDAIKQQRNIESVQRILDYVDDNKSKFAADVYNFYTNKDASQIVQAINQAPFKKKVLNTLDYLKIDSNKYKRVLNEISAIRSKVIHGQRYDHNYIHSKSLTRTQQTVNNKDGWTEVRLGTKLGVVDIVFELIHCILAAYFDRSCSYARSPKIAS